MSATPSPYDLETMLARARHLAASDRNDEAHACYLEVLSRDPVHHAALHELGRLAHATGHRSAARTLYRQIVQCWPRDPAGHINLGNILYDDGDFAVSRMHFEAALEIDSGSADAHRGMGRILANQADDAGADRHWRLSFPGQAIAIQSYRGRGQAVPILLLVSAKGGNIPTGHIFDDHIFAVTALYVEYYRPDLPLPLHALIFNAIGDADFCPAGLEIAERIATRSGTRMVNSPAIVRRTGRVSNAVRLADIPGLRVPRTLALSRLALDGAKTLGFPLLLRAPGFHTGQHFVRVEYADALAPAAKDLPGETLLAIEYLDARGNDGMARKYRVMFIDGKLYPMHLAISSGWKVHYFTADMAPHAAHRAEEKLFLENMPAILGVPAVTALRQIGETLGLDYCGIDFALDGGGSVLLFEANATMVINPPPPEPIWDYRRVAVARALSAAKELLITRSSPQQQ